jgi:hypothetical protein
LGWCFKCYLFPIFFTKIYSFVYNV